MSRLFERRRFAGVTWKRGKDGERLREVKRSWESVTAIPEDLSGFIGFIQIQSLHQPTEKTGAFLKNSPRDGGGGGLSWKVGRSPQGGNPVLERRGSERLESNGGNWSEEIAGEIRLQTRVKWRAGCWGESTRKANRQGRPASAKPAKNSTPSLSNQG